MKKLVIIVGLVLAFAGCQTSITAEKHPEVAHAVQKVVQVNGQDQVITDHYEVTSGGWYATARSPLYAAEALSGLEIGVHTNGSVTLVLDKYDRDISTNAVVMVKNVFDGGVQLITAAGEAYAKIAGGGAQADTVLNVAKSIYKSFTDNGGSPEKAKVDIVDGNVVMSDGSVCTTCTTGGECTTGACSE